MLITLARLGLRAGEAAGLTLEDIDWASGRLSVVGKGQRRLKLPVPADVGQALVAWLQVRPTDADDRAVFVRLRAPIGKLTSAGISDIVTHAAERAEVEAFRDAAPGELHPPVSVQFPSSFAGNALDMARLRRCR